MRRCDREVKDNNLIKEFIDNEQILRVAFYDEGDIYIVPVNYGYVYDGQYTFFFHGAKAGRKYELAKDNPKVGFEIDGKYSLLKSDIACDFSATFQSVIGMGRLSLIEDEKEKIVGLNAIMKQTTSEEAWNYSDKMLESVALFRLDVDKLSCKAK